MKTLFTETLDLTKGHGWGERNVSQFHKQFSNGIARGCSSSAQRFFATPEVVDDKTVSYLTDDYQVARKFGDLKPAEKDELRRKIQLISHEIEALRQSWLESGENNSINTANAMDAIFMVPDESAIWSIDGEPVVAPWGVYGSENIDLRTISGPELVEPAVIDIIGKKPIRKKKRWRLPLFLLALLLVLGVLAYLFGAKIACSQGWISCTAPVAVDDAATLRHNSTTVDIDITANDNDPDGGPLIVTGCDIPVAVLNDSSVQFVRPNGGSSSTVTFNCTVADEDNQTATAKVTVTLEPTPNSAPIGRAMSLVLPIGKPSVDADILSAVTDTDPHDTLTILACSSPATLSGQKVTYSRQSALKALTDNFSCDVSDANGAKTTVPVNVVIETAENHAPVGSPLTVLMPLGQNTVDVDVLSAVTDLDVGDVHTVLSCTSPGQLKNGKVSYTRTFDEKVLSENFLCSVTDAKGSTALVPVTVNIEPSRCTPVDVSIPVKVIIGTDWSGSMEVDTNGVIPQEQLRLALKTFQSQMSPKVSASIGWMAKSVSHKHGENVGPTKQIDDGDKDFPGFVDALGSASPDFGIYQDWLVDELRQAESAGYGKITIVTITDAGDSIVGVQYAHNGYSVEKMKDQYLSMKTPIEHIVISLRQGPNIAEIEKMVWPENQEANFLGLYTEDLAKQLPDFLLEAANLITRRDCK